MAHTAAFPPERGSTPQRMLREALDLFDALASAGQGPLVLIIDDLHWVDRPTLDLITALGAADGQRRCWSSARTGTPTLTRVTCY